jgi:hypothetical protein
LAESRKSILHDNSTLAVAKISGDGKRARAFNELISYYLLRSWFGCPGKGQRSGQPEYHTCITTGLGEGAVSTV